MLVYLVRHGETVGNAKNFHQFPETPLTEIGIDQAVRVAKRLKNKNIDLIYSSTHSRAMETSGIIAEQIKAPVEGWSDLIEVRRPKEIVGKQIDDPEAIKIKDLIQGNSFKRNWRFSDEENFEDVNQRTQRVLDHLLNNHKHQTVVCVSHGTFIKSLILKVLFGEKLTSEFIQIRNHFKIKNTGISVIEYTEEYGWDLVTLNDMSHL